MSLAAETRAAVRSRPFLYEALRAGVVNYSAVARTLSVDGDVDAVTAALRRFAADLEPCDHHSTAVRLTMESGLTRAADGLFVVGDTGFARGDGELTGVLATGSIKPSALEHVLGVLRIHEIEIVAAGMASGTLIVIVDRRDGAAALRRMEAALDCVPA